MAVTKNSTDTLYLLISAALALPGMSAHAADPDIRNDNYMLSYTHGAYSESGNRMTARIDAATLTVPIGDRYEVKIDKIRDVMSGASVFTNIAPNGQPMLVKTQATIRDQRDSQNVGIGYYSDDYYASIDFGHSAENDYIANFVNGTYRHYLNEKTTTLLIGAGVSFDTVWDKYYPPYGSAEIQHQRRQQDLSIGVSQILDINSVGQLILSHGYGSGDLNSQYRHATVMTGNVPSYIPDTRPDNHTQWTLLTRYSHYFSNTKSALHLDYRLGIDSWGANSHTLEGKWRFALSNTWSISPGLRYYTQKSASFYDVYFNSKPANNLISSDYRLAGFGVLSPKLEVAKQFDKGSFVLFSYENYIRKRSYAMGESRGSDIDDYHAKVLALSVQYVF